MTTTTDVINYIYIAYYNRERKQPTKTTKISIVPISDDNLSFTQRLQKRMRPEQFTKTVEHNITVPPELNVTDEILVILDNQGFDDGDDEALINFLSCLYDNPSYKSPVHDKELLKELVEQFVEEIECQVIN